MARSTVCVLLVLVGLGAVVWRDPSGHFRVSPLVVEVSDGPAPSTTALVVPDSSVPEVVMADPLTVDPDGALCVTLGNGTLYSLGPAVLHAGRLTLRRLAEEGNGIRRVVIEVGTNTRPELALVVDDGATFFIPFEPMPHIFTTMASYMRRRSINASLWSNVMPVPAAVSPTSGHLTLHESTIPGCSSLLPMSRNAFRAYSNEANARVAKFQSLRKRPTKVTGIRIASVCATGTRTHRVPVFPLSSLLRYVPLTTPIDILLIDAQGFDLAVALTLSASDRDRVFHIILECQNLAPRDERLLTVGAKTCGEQFNCVARSWKWTLRRCWWNSKHSHEFNCLYTNPMHEKDERSLLRPLDLEKLFQHPFEWAAPELILFETTAPKC